MNFKKTVAGIAVGATTIVGGDTALIEMRVAMLPEHLKLPAQDTILLVRDADIVLENSITDVRASSTDRGTVAPTQQVKVYDYVSNIPVEGVVFRGDSEFSGERVVTESGRTKKVEFYNGSVFKKGADGVARKIFLGATTTPEAYELQTRKTLLDQAMVPFITRAQAQTTATYTLANTNDDATEYVGLLFRTVDSMTNPGHDGTYVMNGSYRFSNITIPQGATIDEAIVHYKIGTASQPGAPQFRIAAHDIDNATTAIRPSTFTETTANVAWSGLPSTNETWIQTPDIKTVIQEIVDRAGWSSGNGINVGLIRTAGTSAFRRFYDITNGANYPYIEVTYTTAGGGGDTRTPAFIIF